IASARRREVTAAQPSASAMVRAASRICCLRSAVRRALVPGCALAAPDARWPYGRCRLRLALLENLATLTAAKEPGKIMFNALAVVATTVLGVMVGVEFAVAVFVNPMLLQLAAGPSQQGRAWGG